MTFEQYQERVRRIEKWYDEYVLETFKRPEDFGHLYASHMNKSDAFLTKRSIEIQKDASSFVGEEEEIKEMIHQTLLRCREEVIEYLADEDDSEPWEIKEDLPEHVTGKIYQRGWKHDWKDGPKDCEHFIISIKKSSNKNENGFIITSAYPIP